MAELWGQKVAYKRFRVSKLLELSRIFLKIDKKNIFKIA